jgi:hypothetical protein
MNAWVGGVVEGILWMMNMVPRFFSFMDEMDKD